MRDNTPYKAVVLLLVLVPKANTTIFWSSSGHPLAISSLLWGALPHNPFHLLWGALPPAQIVQARDLELKAAQQSLAALQVWHGMV